MITIKTTSPRNWNRLVKAVENAEALREASKWPLDSAADRGAKVAAYHAAKKRLDEAREALKKAFSTASWGQNGSVFITDRGYLDRSRTRTLHINGRARATYEYKPFRKDPEGRVEIISAKDAEMIYRQERAECRRQQEAYLLHRDQLIVDLRSEGVTRPRSFEGWAFYDGQCGGIFCRESDGVTISAHGALKGAWGKNWQDLPDFYSSGHELEWDRKIYGARW